MGLFGICQNYRGPSDKGSYSFSLVIEVSFSSFSIALSSLPTHLLPTFSLKSLPLSHFSSLSSAFSLKKKSIPSLIFFPLSAAPTDHRQSFYCCNITLSSASLNPKLLILSLPLHLPLSLLIQTPSFPI